MWTVDWPEDVAFMQRVFSNLQVEGEIFTLNDVLTVLEAEGELFDRETVRRPMAVRDISRSLAGLTAN